MKIFRRIKLWYYRHVMGYFMPGSLVLFNPPDDSLGLQIRDPRRDPEIGRIGLSLGSWRFLRSPGFTVVGTTVLIDGRQYNLYTWDLEVIDD